MVKLKGKKQCSAQMSTKSFQFQTEQNVIIFTNVSKTLSNYQFNSIQFNSLFHFTQGNTILTVYYQIIYINKQ